MIHFKSFLKVLTVYTGECNISARILFSTGVGGDITYTISIQFFCTVFFCLFLFNYHGLNQQIGWHRRSVSLPQARAHPSPRARSISPSFRARSGSICSFSRARSGSSRSFSRARSGSMSSSSGSISPASRASSGSIGPHVE